MIFFLTSKATCKSSNLHWWEVGCESYVASLQKCLRRITDKKETPGRPNQRPVRKMDKQTEELRPSRLANGDTYELWEFVQYRLTFFFFSNLRFIF